MPESFVITTDGLLFAANGIDPVLQWDGYSSTLQPAGIAAPTTAITLSAGGGAGTITGKYDCYMRFIRSDGQISNLSPVSNEIDVVAVTTVTYSNCPTPTDPLVNRRQILRNTAGQKTTYYVDIETADLAGTTFTSTKTDAQLRASTAVPFFDADGNNIVNVNNAPPNNKPFMAWHQNRMFYAGVTPYSAGSIRVAKVDGLAVGSGTEWKATMVGRLMYIDGADKTYTVATVDVTSQTISFVEVYTGADLLWATYSIRPVPIESDTIYFSEPNQAAAVPPTNAYVIPQDGDTVTGMMNYRSFLYILKTRRCYKLTTRTNPIADGRVFQGINRGCINNRCWVIANETAYMMDEGGVYAFYGDAQGETVSPQIQDIFRRDDASEIRINWGGSNYFHASHSPQEEVIRWFVTLEGERLPRHALAYGYTTQRWWIEEYQYPITASCLGREVGSRNVVRSGSEQVYLGSDGNRVLALNGTGLDGVVRAKAARGFVTSSEDWTLTDTSQQFDAGITNAVVHIVQGTGAGQSRRIIEVDGDTIRVDRPWSIRPRTDCVYQVGGVPFNYRTRRARYLRSEVKIARQIEVNYIPIPPAKPNQQVTVSVVSDYQQGPKIKARTMDKGMSTAQQTEAGQIGTTVPMDQTGFQLISHNGWFEGQTDSPKAMQLLLSGSSGPHLVRFNSLLLSGIGR